MPSGISWLLLSSAKINEARRVLRSIELQGTVDELGFQKMSRKISDYFYPAITTLMTRPRYLFFIASMYRYLESGKCKKGNSVEKRSRELQNELLEKLMDLYKETREGKGMGEGIIGRISGRDLVRIPSEIYWNALRELDGIMRFVKKSNSFHNPNSRALKSAVAALLYLKNPYDRVFDFHVEGGFEDDCEMIRKVWKTIQSSK